jgi:hypothetical protein
MDTMFPTAQTNIQRSVILYHKALVHGWMRQLWSRITRHRFCLEDLNKTLESNPVRSSHYGGLKTVAIQRIRGTEGKADAFDAEFNPLQENTRIRWLNIAEEKIRGYDLPPVELLQVGDVYYVRDGHHRISVSRSLGQDFIDAEVTVLSLQCQPSLANLPRV